jgi:CHAT domain-containing protein
MGSKIIKVHLFIFCFTSVNLFSQRLPLNLYWSGKTDSALLISNKILFNKKTVLASELANAYDFLAEYNLEQGQFENNFKYITLKFKTTKNTSIDSALYFARLANYYNCFVILDSVNYFFCKASKAFLHHSFKIGDKLNYARYYSYIGNATRNSIYRNVKLLDSAIILCDNNFLKALHYRRYATFLSDLLNLSEQQWKINNNLNLYKKSISCLSNAERLATKIYPNKKSCLHGSIYKIWAVILKYRRLVYKSLDLVNKTKLALVVNDSVINNSDYSAIITWEASTNMSLFYKTKNINYLFKNEELLINSISVWEKFYKKVNEDYIKGFDDQFGINPYQKLLAVYFQLYQSTKNQLYISKCYSLIEFIKNINKQHDGTLLSKNNSEIFDSISNYCKRKNCSVINYFITHNPVFTIAIISLPDTTLMINCSVNNDYIPLNHSNRIFQRDTIRNNDFKFKKLNYLMYEAYFLKIDSVLSKRKITNVAIINDGFLNSLSFDLLQTDSIRNRTFFQPSLIKKYKFSYFSSGHVLLKNNTETIRYKQLNILLPKYNATNYSHLIFGERLEDQIGLLFNINNIFKGRSFLDKNQLLQYLGHVKSDDNAREQYLILNDSEVISSNFFFKKNLEGSSYLLNGCGSSIGREIRFDKVKSFPYILLNQNANAVITTLWPIDDKDNAEFLEKFYNYLSEGLSSSDALRQTKLYFAKNNYSPSMWGAYIYYGNDFYLSKKETSYLYIYISIGMILVIAIIFIFLKKLKLRNNTL